MGRLGSTSPPRSLFSMPCETGFTSLVYALRNELAHALTNEGFGALRFRPRSLPSDGSIL